MPEEKCYPIMCKKDTEVSGSIARRKVLSNKLAKRHLPEFESYVEIMQQNGCVTRRVNFSDENREINVPLKILVGERETPATFLLDTGAQRSFISQRMYDKKLSKIVKKRNSYVRMYGVGGNELETTGEIEVDLELGDEIVRQKFIIARLKEDGILGFDFCRNHQAEWRWRDKEISLKCAAESARHIEVEESCVRVMTKANVQVPARSEIVVSGIIEGVQKAPQVGMIEPQSSFVEKYSLGVAAVLAQKMENSVPVRLINATEQDINVQKNTHVALYSPAAVLDDVTVRTTGGITDEWNIEEQFESQLSQLTTEEKEDFYRLVKKYQNQFMVKKDNIGRTNLVQHHIRTGNNAPVKQRPRREPLGMQGIVQEEIQKMEEKGIIEPSTSPWASPVVLVRKKDGSVRFCIDYRKLNSLTEKDAYPLPRIDDNLDALKGARWFSTLDLASGYWQVEMAQEDREKTAFCTKYGLHQFRVMPFGLCNAPGTFERLMETVLKGMQWHRAVLYLDDIIIFSESVEEHLERLEEIFMRLKNANLTLKPSKCHFFQKKVEFLGHIVDEEGIHTDPAKIQAVYNWEIPKRVKDVRAFLGLTGYYRRFIQGYGKDCKAITSIDRKRNSIYLD